MKNLLKRIKIDFKKTILVSMILEVLFLIFGIFIFMKPFTAIKVVGVTLGIYLIILGLYAIYEFLERDYMPIFKYKIFKGIASVILGIFIMLNPFTSLKILTLVVGINLSVMGIVKLLQSLTLKKYKYDGWVVTLAIAILIIIFGVFIAINPMSALDIVEASAIFIILGSILELCNLFMFYTKSKEIVKLFKKKVK